MDNYVEFLPISAITIIYPDGEVDQIGIDKEELHIEYFNKLRKKSKRFKKICRKCDFRNAMHFDIDQKLGELGAITLYNYDIKDIAGGKSILDPCYVVYLPEKLQSLEQFNLFDEFIQIYPEDKILYGIFRNAPNSWLKYRDVTKEKVNEYLDEARNRLEDNILERRKLI